MSASCVNENVLNLPENVEVRVSENDPNVITIGDIPDELLDRRIKVAIGARRDAKEGWNNHDFSVYEFISGLTKHVVGKKDGKSFLQGTSHDGTRNKNVMETLYVLGLDWDIGASHKQLIKRIRELGYVAVVYSTHSHLKPQSDVAEKEYLKGAKKLGLPDAPTKESLAAFMLAHNKITPELAETVTGFTKGFGGKKGFTYYVDHAPMERWRVVFFLEKPFDIPSRGGSQQDSLDEWSERYEAVGALFDAPIDSMCKDASRLFYLPRHDKGKEYKVYVVGGDKFLDIDLLRAPKSDVSAKASAPLADATNEFAAAAQDMGANRSGKNKVAEYSDMPSGVAWQDWFATYAKRLKLADLLRDRLSSDDIRKDDENKLTVPCPFESGHTPTDDPDEGFFVMNADDTDTGAFLASCSHISCGGHPMTDFLHGLILSGVIAEEDLTDERYLCQSEDDKAFAKLLKTAQGFGRLTSSKVIERLYDGLAALDLSPMQLDEIIGVVVSKLGQRKSDVTKALGKAKKAHAYKVEKERKEAERRAQNEAAANGESDAVVELNVQTDGMDVMMNASTSIAVT